MTRPMEKEQYISDLKDSDKFIIIGSWVDPNKNTLTIQNFVRDGVSFIPLFSDGKHFAEETLGSGFENSGIEIDRGFLLSLLNGDEILILNPGSDSPVQLRKNNLL